MMQRVLIDQWLLFIVFFFILLFDYVRVKCKIIKDTRGVTISLFDRKMFDNVGNIEHCK